MSDHIVELQMKLQQNRIRNDTNSSNSCTQHRMHTAAVDVDFAKIVTRTAKVKQLLDYGYNKSEISQHLKLHPYIIDWEIGRIEKEEKERRRFLTTGRLPEHGGVFTIYNDIPTPR
jgi:hypothetical protein